MVTVNNKTSFKKYFIQDTQKNNKQYHCQYLQLNKKEYTNMCSNSQQEIVVDKIQFDLTL